MLFQTAKIHNIYRQLCLKKKHNREFVGCDFLNVQKILCKRFIKNTRKTDAENKVEQGVGMQFILITKPRKGDNNE